MNVSSSEHIDVVMHACCFADKKQTKQQQNNNNNKKQTNKTTTTTTTTTTTKNKQNNNNNNKKHGAPHNIAFDSLHEWLCCQNGTLFTPHVSFLEGGARF